MNSVLDHDVDAPTQPYPMTELLRTYLQQSRGVSFSTLGAERREQPATTSAQDLWDYLGDFA